MSLLYEEETESRTDADVTLGMGSLLSIFFGVVLICGIFFGFGYSMGRRNTQTTVATRHSSAVTPADDAATESARPEVRQPAPTASADTAVTEPAETKPTDAVEPKPEAKHTDAAPAEAATHDTTAEDVAATPAAKPAKAAHQPPSAAAAPPTPTLAAVPFTHRAPLLTKPHAGTVATLPAAEPPLAPGHPLMVQIAAVSREEDAQVLAGALRKRGFSPQVHGGTADKFFHVQVGPFADKDQAESVKQHLLADGYNAILK